MSGITTLVSDQRAVAAADPRAEVRSAPSIGLIGLAEAGRAVALALLGAGLHPLACDPDEGRRQAYRNAAGSHAAITDDPAEVARRCTVVVLLQALGEDAATIHAVLADGLAAGSLIIDMGPALPGGIRRLAGELAARGLRLVDAPVVREPAVVLAGGSEADVALARLVLDAVGPVVVATGPVGSAQALSAFIAEIEPPPDLARVREWASG